MHMLKLKSLVPYIAGSLVAVVAIGILRTPKVSAAIKAAFVEIAIPSNPFFNNMIVLNAATSIGPDSGTLGVTNLTLTNFDSTAQQVFIFAPVFSTGGCGGPSADIIGGGGPQMQFYVQPQQTLSISYPSPLTFHGISGHTCVAAEVTTLLHGGSVEITVNGFVN
jgi:hypothetical protein